MANRKWRNPFYALLVPTGALFCITAIAYVVMAFRAMKGLRAVPGEATQHPLLGWLQTHGNQALLIQLAVLAVLTLGAIGTDSWWTNRQPSGAEPNGKDES